MQILPYLYFDGDCEVAFRFYERCLGVDKFGTPWMVNCDWAP